MEGLMSNNCTTSPLCKHNKVWLIYTDGNSFSGALDAPINYTSPSDGVSHPLWFRGRANLDAALDALSRNVMNATNLWSNVRHVVETGCSAGGLATYLHSNYLLEKLAGVYSGVFVSMPVSGFFLNHANPEGQYIYGSGIRAIHALSNASTDSACEAQYAATGDTWKCNMAEYVYPFLKAPVFVLNSIYDSWQSECIMTAEPVYNETASMVNGNCSASPGWNKCAIYPNACTANQLTAGYLPFGEHMTNFFKTSKKALTPGNGGFLTSCHTHCDAMYDNPFTENIVGGKSMSQATHEWYAVNTAATPPLPPLWAIDCAYSTMPGNELCNPTCNPAN